MDIDAAVLKFDRLSKRMEPMLNDYEQHVASHGRPSDAPTAPQSTAAAPADPSILPPMLESRLKQIEEDIESILQWIEQTNQQKANAGSGPVGDVDAQGNPLGGPSAVAEQPQTVDAQGNPVPVETTEQQSAARQQQPAPAAQQSRGGKKR